MKKGTQILIFIQILVISLVNAQEYGNEWINYSQKYYKLSTAEDGIYRISYNELASADFPVSTIDPRNIKIFHRGIEQSIHIEGQNDASFDPADYIEFFGKKNDGTLDEELFVTPEAQPHKYYNFYSDTTAYFLTWSLSEPGKRIVPFKENNVLNLPPEPYHFNEYVDVQSNNYSIGLHHPIGVVSSETYLTKFDHGEGWTGTAFRQGQYKDVVFSNLENSVTSGPKPILEILLTGRNNLDHSITIEVGSDQNNLRSIKDISFKYHYDTLITDTLEWSDISGGSLLCRVSVTDNGVADRVSISFARLVFADRMDQESSEQKNYHIKPTNTNRSYLEIQNVPSGAKLYDVSDEENIIDIGYNVVGSGINTIVPNNLEGRQLLLTSRRIQVPNIEPVSMRNIDPSNANFLIVSHKSLRKATANYADVPQSYASYRASTTGGGFDTLVVNIDQLYDMFSYGEYTSLALYRFCKFMADKGDPQYLFIMGKGLTGLYLYPYRTGTSGDSNRDLIPTGGFPGSDLLFTAGLKGTTYESGFPVGRVSAETPTALEAYLDKVKEAESTPHDALWRKELVHLSGGSDAIQQDLFLRYVDGFKSVAESEMLGGDVVTISKKTNGATELINIAEYVNAGKMLVTFFGHSGATGADIEIGYVSNEGLGYNNSGKYPILIVNGCNAGDMYNTGYGFGEDWIGTPDKGAVGFIAHTGAGLTTRLKRYTDLFYEVAFTDSLFLKKGIGDIQKEVGKRYLERYSHSEMDISQIQQMSLQGDPYVSLFGVSQPDFEINSDNVFAQSIDREPINAFTEVFNLGLIVRNFGTTHRDSLQVSINRKLSNGTEYNLDTMVYAPVFYKDTLYFEIETVGIDGFGLNQFTITLDPLNEIDELSEINNKTTFDYFVPLGGTNNIFPAKYSIINKKETRLVAHSLDLLMDNRTYLFELDTTILFNSPYRKQGSVQGRTLARWSVDLFGDLPEKDTIVFYWRTKFAEPRPDELDIWNTTSFTYINNGNNGWAMAHFQQFEGNETNNIVLNQESRAWEFEKFETRVTVKTFGNLHPDFDYENVELIINNTPYIFPTRLCTDNSINLLAFDKSTTIPYLVLGKSFILDRTNCGRIPQLINNMLKSDIETKLWIEAYIDAMDNGDFVVLFSIGNVTFQSWPVSTLTKLGEIGVDASDIQSISDGEPLIIIGKKGANPGSATIMKADYSNPTPANEQEIMLEQMINGQAASGTVRSPRIGPSANWVSFHQQTEVLEEPVTDLYSFNIYGIDALNKEVLLEENIMSTELDLQSIDEASYPYLRLEMKLTDEVNLTPAQLKNWFVIFEGVPEGVLSYNPGQKISGIEKIEGEIHEAVFTFENVSDIAFSDSLAIEFSLFNQDERKSYTDTVLIKALNAEESVDISLSIETLGKPGKNDFKVFANPYLQAEQNFNNNYINLPEYLIVNKDNTNPILEVTVDGEFIMDGDIVAPSPMIVLRMKDENGVLFKEDTMGINLYLNEKCEGCVPSRISFSSPNVIWTPATAENDFMVEYHPESLADGIYALKAEAADASGNPSGTEPYAVSFEIINESQITNFFPYPNPFSSRTQFVFTLTGGEIPDEIIIQIMTVNGTVVREITQDEIGPIKIGNNKTEYAWDGHDEYGDQLANGVYLYKVKIFNHGKEMKHRSTSADKAFKHGIGKMYLLR